VPADSVATVSVISPDERRWLHDKYERLSAEESQLSASRTAYFATIGAVLLTGFVVLIADLLGQPSLFAIAATLLASLGILTSAVWTALLHRTNDAQKLWREAALHLEQAAPPIEGEFRAPISLRSGESISLDLFRPFQSHQERFSAQSPISWMDRLDPAALTELLPQTFLVVWSAILVVVWIWFLFLR